MRRRTGKASASRDQLRLRSRRESAHATTYPSLADEALRALLALVAVIDTKGEIILVNDAWLDAACMNDSNDLSTLSVGANYLDICRQVANTDTEVRHMLEGIQSVLDGSQPSFTAEYRCDSPTQQRWYLMSVTPVRVANGIGAVIAHQEITVHKEAERERRANEAWLQALYKNAAIGIGELSAHGRWLRSNERLSRLTGLSNEQLRRRTYLELVATEDADSLTVHLDLAQSGAIDSFVHEHRLIRNDGSLLWVNASLSGVRGPSDALESLIIVFEDISERKAAEDRQRTLMIELAERSKSLLSVVQSIASRSLMTDRPPDETWQAFEGRLQALSNSFSSLTGDDCNGTPLDYVLHGELQPFGAHASVNGPPLAMTMKSTQTMALVIHELVTNAAKYGALSVASGRVAVKWDIVGDPKDRRFVFEWNESGGPCATPPSRTGFGTDLIQHLAAGELDCHPELRYTQEGFSYRLDAPLAKIGTAQLDSPIGRRVQNSSVRALYDAWQRHARKHGALPPLTGFDWNRFAGTGALTMATIDDHGKPYSVQIGQGLRGQIPETIRNEKLVLDSGTSIAQAYQRCVGHAEPTHEYMRFDLGDGALVTFERLLIPFTTHEEHGVTHVIGMVIFKEIGSAGPGAIDIIVH